MDEIKSSKELAEEKMKAMGEVTEEERLRWKYLPLGESLGASFIHTEATNLTVELAKYDEKAKTYIKRGVETVLLGNINLPRTDGAKRNNKRAMEGLKSIKNDKVAVENLFSQMRYIFNHFEEFGEQQKKQAYENAKADFTNKLRQAAQQQYGTAQNISMDAEAYPQFQDEWRRSLAQLELGYIQPLDDLKKELARIE